MSEFAIRLYNIGKQYRIGQRNHYVTLRDTLSDALRTPLRFLRANGGQSSSVSNPHFAVRELKSDDYFWALRNVSFDVKPGEVVGIIGCNGAGKSTLLKILSRICMPTEGYAEVRGRVGSLLEVGTGFHPELTGRENIYLNGAVLGMKKKEIESKYDQIVSFAEIEKFLDTPIKHYSSGMYLRLAFAVAAHLEPEILLVDEVLAVGDVAFQEKCLAKMGEIAKEGRTVLFVSHTMAAVQSLCTRAILLKTGGVDFDGVGDVAIQRYISTGYQQILQQNFPTIRDRKGSGDIFLTSFRIEDSAGLASESLLNGKPYTFVLGFQVQAPDKSYDNIAAAISVRTMVGTRVFYHHNLLTGEPFNKVNGKGEFRFHIPRLPLSAGYFYVDLDLSRDRGQTMVDTVQGQASFEVCDGGFFGSGFEYRGGTNAVVMVDGTWSYSQG